MEITVPDMNPLRFYKFGETPDWVSKFPNMENVYPGQEWIAGVNHTKFINDWVLGNTIAFQFAIYITTDAILIVRKLNSSGIYESVATIIPVNITPLGWVSESVYKYEYTFPSEGVYYFESVSAGYRSEKIVVHSDLKMKKRLVKLQYENTVNDYGMVFIDNGTPRYTGLIFLTGQLILGSPKNEISALKSDRGQLVKLRGTPIRTATLKLTDIFYADIDKINLILSCDTLTINGVTYQNEETGEAEQIGQTDLFKINVKLTQTNYNYHGQ
jgi:hypothetical protein